MLKHFCFVLFCFSVQSPLHCGHSDFCTCTFLLSILKVKLFLVFGKFGHVSETPLLLYSRVHLKYLTTVMFLQVNQL